MSLHNLSMWPQLSSSLEHVCLSLSLLFLSWCAADLVAPIGIASARGLASRLTHPVAVSTSQVPHTRPSHTRRKVPDGRVTLLGASRAWGLCTCCVLLAS